VDPAPGRGRDRAAPARARLGGEPGERYRFNAPPGIRITTTTLEPAEAKHLAAALAEIAHSGTETYAG
jgi:hypothetical protein